VTSFLNPTLSGAPLVVENGRVANNGREDAEGLKVLTLAGHSWAVAELRCARDNRAALVDPAHARSRRCRP
jgi:hypothetical protein